MLGGILMRTLDMGLQKIKYSQTCDLGTVFESRGWNIAQLIWVGRAPLGRFLRGAHKLCGRLCDSTDVGVC